MNLGLEQRHREALEAARDQRTARISHAVDSVGGGKVLRVYAPIFVGDTFDGFIVGVLHVQRLFDIILYNNATTHGHSLAIFDGDEEIYAHYDPDRRPEAKWETETEIAFYGATWRMRTWPGPELLLATQSPLPEVVLIGGLLTAALFALVIRFAQRASLRAEQLEVSNRALSNEITERIRAEKELQQAHDELKRRVKELARSNAELEQFGYVASHDLQEPLRAVSGFLQLLERHYKGKLDPTADEFIQYAVDGALRMQTLINDLLAYSRVRTRGKSLELTDCVVALERALANLEVAVDESGAVITHDTLPEVLADPTQLTQLFQNLIGNAIKFRGSQPPKIHIGVDESGDEWVFSVQDNGIGIDAQYYERIFVIFKRLHTRDKYPGTGIGLAICRNIVERHGGRIWVDSQLGEGATFYFTIPKSPALPSLPSSALT